jgi:CelD/BcsL family acetyltransferase involved in cellulose biosynthesis
VGVSAGLTIREISDLNEPTRLLPAWDALWKQCQYATTFSRPQWLLSWIEVFRPEQPCILLVENDTKPLGLAPFLIYREGEERVLGLMGGGVSDYLDILVAPGFERIVTEAIWDWLARSKSDWDRVYFSDLHRDSPLLRQPNEPYLACEGHDACPTLGIHEISEIAQVVSPKTMHNLRTARARMKREGGGTIEIAGRNSLESMLDDLFRLHTARWNDDGHSGVLKTDQVRAFHKEVAPWLLEEGVLRLYGLRHGGQIIASLYALFEATTVFCYLQGYDPAYRFLSPGTQILAAVIEDAIRQGKQTVDLLRGREPYKYIWGAQDRITYRLVRKSISDKQRLQTQAA